MEYKLVIELREWGFFAVINWKSFANGIVPISCEYGSST